MRLALEQARLAATLGEVPVGAVLVNADSGEILGSDHNRVEALRDPLAHAELLVLQAVARERGEKRLPMTDLYVTLEPCSMCAGAISLARVRRLYFGAYDPKSGGVEHGPRVFQQPTRYQATNRLGGLRFAGRARGAGAVSARG